MNFQDQTVLITGGSGGIGESIAMRMANLGAYVMITGRNQSKLATIAATNQRIQYVGADLQSPDAYDYIIQHTLEQFSSLNVLINNAGILDPLTLESATLARLQRLFHMHVVAPTLLVQAALPYLRKSKGHVINIGSSLGHIAQHGQIGYGTSKAALEQLTKNMAIELADYQIKVNCIAPGPTATNILKTAGFSESEIRQSNNEMKNMVPLGRRGLPEEIADIVSKICDPSVRWLTGQILSVDGGMSVA
jgi:NAD(P)-dependent dehydrogenase (short-subunit alcohol dehydrogenase family)